MLGFFNLILDAMDTLYNNGEHFFSQPIKRFVNRDPIDHLKMLQSNLSEITASSIPANSNEIHRENTVLLIPDS